jgi:FMN phosphatase YigB (HAD superfamily)
MALALYDGKKVLDTTYSVLSQVPSFSKLPTVSTQLYNLVFKTKFIVSDANGCIYPDEPSQMEAFTDLLNKKTGARHDFRVIAKEMIGKPERVIISEFKENYGLKGDPDTLLQERENMYLTAVYKAVHSGRMQPNPDLIWAVTKAKELGRPTAILSNGREKIIRPLTGHLGISKLFDDIYSIDSKPRLSNPAFADKIVFLEHKADCLGIEMSDILLFEDSVRTLEKAAMHDIHGIYVDHDLTTDHDYIPNSGIVLRFPQPC